MVSSLVSFVVFMLTSFMLLPGMHLTLPKDGYIETRLSFAHVNCVPACSGVKVWAHNEAFT